MTFECFVHQDFVVLRTQNGVCERGKDKALQQVILLTSQLQSVYNQSDDKIMQKSVKRKQRLLELLNKHISVTLTISAKSKFNASEYRCHILCLVVLCTFLSITDIEQQYEWATHFCE